MTPVNEGPAALVRWVLLTLLASAVLAFSIQFLEFNRVFANTEGAVADWYLTRDNARTRTPHIVTVAIDNTDHVNWFNGATPLDAVALLELVSALQKTGASVIGVDILTDSWDYLHHDAVIGGKLKGALDGIGASDVPVVWAAGEEPYIQPVAFKPWLAGKHDVLWAKPGKLFGQPSAATHVKWGVPVFPADADGKVRQYQREWHDSSGTIHENQRTLAGAIADAYCERQPCDNDRTAEEVLIAYSSNVSVRPDYYVRELFTCVARQERLCRGFEPKPAARLDGRIAMLGGTYDASHDFYATPAGRSTPGLIVNAHALQAEIHGPLVREFARPLTVGLDVLIGFTIGFLFSPYIDRLLLPRLEASSRYHRWLEEKRVGWRIAASVGIALLAAAASLPLFAIAGFVWVSWVGMVLVGVAWHIVWEARHLRVHS